MNDSMNELLNLGTSQLQNPTLIITGILTSFVIALIIVYIYRKTHRGLSYSQSFVVTLIFVTMVAAVAMMVIGNNVARAFGLLGAFSIIRFRTVVKEPKDISYIFFALIEGMAVGTGSYLIAIISTILFSIILITLHRFNFGSYQPKRYLLSFLVGSEVRHEENISAIFNKYLKNSLLLNVNSKDDGKMREMIYDIDFFEKGTSGPFVSELASVQGVEKARIITSTTDIEY